MKDSTHKGVFIAAIFFFLIIGTAFGFSSFTIAWGREEPITNYYSWIPSIICYIGAIVSIIFYRKEVKEETQN